jgi:hypothetical protein
MLTAVVPTHYSPAIARIGRALCEHAPASVQIVARPAPIRKDQRVPALMQDETAGELVVIYVNGMHDRLCALAERCVARGQRYAVIQIALRTTRHHSTETWRELWRKAAVVWSYYPLDLWIAEDHGPPLDFNFYHAPLGVDSAIFTLPSADRHRDILVCTSGFQRNQEGVAECDEAAVSVDGRIFQLGPHLDKMKSQVSYAQGITDEELARWYQQCQWVCGLRRHEGFELPAAEGLLCGARPLFYDRPHYRCWFEQWAEFVPEEPHDLVVENLKRLFKRGPKPVSERERAEAAMAFSWPRVVHGFWDRCGA